MALKKLSILSKLLHLLHPVSKGAHQAGYWIPISHEKISHIPKSREKDLIFPIPNVPPRHSFEYFVFDREPPLKQ